jgi:hypothetical protein
MAGSGRLQVEAGLDASFDGTCFPERQLVGPSSLGMAIGISCAAPRRCAGQSLGHVVGHVAIELMLPP